MNFTYNTAWMVILSSFLFGESEVAMSQKIGHLKGSGSNDNNVGKDSTPTQERPQQEQERALRRESHNLVDFLYTYGAPSIANPHMSNPGNKCIPGIRAYTEDVSSGSSCSWWQWWCNPNEHITNTDFAAQLNVDDYPHPKMSTLVLRYRDISNVEYYWMECRDSDRTDRYNFQSWPGTNQPADFNIHNLEWHYERRIREVPLATRGPLLEYTSVSKCGYNKSAGEITNCLNNYALKENGLPGVAPDWDVFAFMNHQTGTMTGTDNDVVYVLKNDNDSNHRKCIISFMGSENLGGDLWNFLFGNAGSTGYCGRYGVHIGVRNELWQITHNSQYQTQIKPALETCHEVTCVGYSLGGSLCNVFTMCANQGEENLSRKDDAGMWDDYHSLVWTKAT